MQTMTIEKTIFSNLIFNENYARRVLPFIKGEYFLDKTDRIIFEEIYNFMDKYQAMATKETLSIELDNRKDLNGTEFQKVVEVIESLKEAEVDMQWLVNTTEKFCKDKAVYNAILNGINIIEGKDKEHTQEAIPSILSEALAVGFDQHIGHDYIENADERFEFYHRQEEKLEFDLEYFNKITKGGLPNISMDDLHNLPKKMFESKIEKINSKTSGKLVIKEYPTASAHSGHFRSLIKELQLKKSFRPDIIFIDYLNICSSSRFKGNASVGSYFYIKAIAEELRGLAVETNLPIMSATQTTRGGFANSDVGLEDTSESFGLPATADLMFALISTEELEGLNQLMIKQLKNRYNDLGTNKRFVVGIDRSKMKLYDCEQEAQQDISDSGQDDTPGFDKGQHARYDKFTDMKF